MAETARYLRELADTIGPRPATTDAEAQAADMIEAVFKTRGLDVERQEFDCPRTYSWAYVIYHVLTMGAAVAAGWPMLIWPAFAVSAVVAFVMFMDLDTRWGLSSIMPKGPSQNIVAKHIPRARRGERVRRVVVVAHYDSAIASLAFSPGLAKNFAITFGLMKIITFGVPVLILADALPFTSAADPYLWYATMAFSAYLLVPTLINAHRELFMHATDGANDNASGVAAMLGVMEQVVPEVPETPTRAFTPVRTSSEHLEQEGLVPDDAVLSYSPAGAPEQDLTTLPDDFEWAEAPSHSPQQGTFDLDTVEFDAVGVEPPVPAREVSDDRLFGAHEPADDFDSDDLDDEFSDPREREDEPLSDPVVDSPSPKRGIRNFFGRGRREGGAVSSWLGVDGEFDARDEGKKIGSWDSFTQDDGDDDGWGSKGGWAGDDPIGDPEFASTEAHRIRRRVTESVDRSLADKEIWFVATGAEESGTWGMRQFLEEHAAELRGASIINIDNIGSGNLHWVTEEGMARRYRADRRLIGAAKRVAREKGVAIRSRAYKGLSTDATPALARGYRALSMMAFDINGRLPNWHWTSDTTDNVDIENIDTCVDFVTGIIREL